MYILSPANIVFTNYTKTCRLFTCNPIGAFWRVKTGKNHFLLQNIVTHRLIDSTFPLAAGLVQKSAQASMSLRRFSNRSPRLYAASTAFGIACASAISATSRGNDVRSEAQSRNVER